MKNHFHKQNPIGGFAMGESLTLETIADEANRIIYGDREETHGDPSKNLVAIADIWSAITGADITPATVCLMMIALKIVRASNNPQHRDNWIDMIGYSLLAERCDYLQQNENAVSEFQKSAERCGFPRTKQET